MSSLLRKYAIKRQVKRIESRSKRINRQYLQYDDINTIIVMAAVQSMEEYETIEDVKQDLEHQGKLVKVIFFFNNKLIEKIPETYNECHITEKDFTWRGKFSQELSKMLEGNDLLMNLSVSSSEYIDYLAKLAQVPLKAGRRNWGNDYLDFMIETKNAFDIELLASQIIFYLRSIQSASRITA